MLNHFGHSFRKGDTLIEVMFAVGVFGLAAVGAISLMNRGLATAQNTLEVTMARQEIDGQAEILRFLHSAYMSSKDPISSNPCGNPQSYRDLWKCITTNYVYKPGNSSGGVEGIDDVDKDFYGRTVTPGDHCDTLFHANGKNDQFSIPDKSFVLNYRNLGSADVNNATLGSVISSYTLVHTAGTYPRLIFTNSTVDCEAEENKDRPECTLSDATITTNAASMQKQLQAAEGIWVTAVASNAGVQCEGEANPRPDFYDFHIQTCWESVAGNTASTISSTVRLFNPDQVQPVKKTTDAGTVNVSVESACVRHSYSPEPEPEPEPTPTPEPEPTPTPEPEPESDPTTMQGFKCEDLKNIGDTGTFTDSRDNNTYTVAKLYDGKCWMTQDLRFTGTSLDPSTSDVSTARTITWSGTIDLEYTMARSSVWTNTDGLAYYSYKGATATTNGNPNESICPKGWKLPSKAQATGLVSNYTDFLGPNEREYNKMRYLVWWTSAASRKDMATIRLEYSMDFSTSAMTVKNYSDDQIGGAFVRCIQQ